MTWPAHTLNLPNQLQRWILARLWRTGTRPDGKPIHKYRIFLHQVQGPDPDRAVHNHPWWAVAIVLRGGYTQMSMKPGYWRASAREEIRWFNVLHLDEYHRIVSVRPNTWTLMLVGPRVRDWGFWSAGRHAPHREFLGLPASTPDLDD